MDMHISSTFGIHFIHKIAGMKQKILTILLRRFQTDLTEQS
jgi:hypothetical protein